MEEKPDKGIKETICIVLVLVLFVSLFVLAFMLGGRKVCSEHNGTMYSGFKCVRLIRVDCFQTSSVDGKCTFDEPYQPGIWNITNLKIGWN